jgi:hypothetical protein
MSIGVPEGKPERHAAGHAICTGLSSRKTIAAQRSKSEAERHVAAAKAILDKGSNPDQAPFYPYLTGYVAFYAGDYKTALAEL